jgi:hypothetical protein
MGIDRHIIGLYGIGGMVGVGGEGYGVVWVEVGLVSGVIGVGGWRFRVFRIRTATLFCARILRDSTPKNRVR